MDDNIKIVRLINGLVIGRGPLVHEDNSVSLKDVKNLSVRQVGPGQLQIDIMAFRPDFVLPSPNGYEIFKDIHIMAVWSPTVEIEKLYLEAVSGLVLAR